MNFFRSLFKFKYFVIFFLLFGSGKLNAADYRKIETNSCNIIYPEDAEDVAQRLANVLDYIYPYVGASLKHKHDKIDYILDNTTITSNGETSHSNVVLYTFPQVDSYFSAGVDWLTLLAIHETRHVVQHEAEFNLLAKISYIFGGAIALNNIKTLFLTIPNWLAEGDAVCTETALTWYGRGALPSYIMSTKALFLERPEKINYHLAFFRSKVQQIPGRYQLGLILTRHLRKIYGPDAVCSLYRRLYSLNYPFFYSAIKKVTGKGLGDLYEEAKKDLADDWQKQVNRLKITESQTISLLPKDKYMNYYYPQQFDENNIVALKTDRNERNGRSEFVIIDKNTKKERLLTNHANLYDTTLKFSAQKNAIVWLEKHKNIFTGETSALVIVMYDKDRKGHKKHSIAKGRFTFVALSHDKKKVAVLETSLAYKHSLQILDVESGNVIKKFDNPENKMYLNFCWSEQDDVIYAVSSHNDEVALESIDIKTNASDYIIKPSHNNLANPYQKGNYVYYSSSYSGIDNIYAVNIDTKKIYQISSRKYGAFSPSLSFDSKKIYFSDFTIEGTRLLEMDFNEKNWIPIESVEDVNINFEKVLRDQENKIILQKDIPNKVYSSSKYNILRKHLGTLSWLINPDISFWGNNAGKFALKGKLIGDNVFKSIKSLLEYQYEFKEKVHSFGLGLEFLKIYPILKFKYEGNFSKESKFSENKFSPNISTPLYTTINHIILEITPKLELEVVKRLEEENDFSISGFKQELQPQVKLRAYSSTLGDYTIEPKKLIFKLIYSKQKNNQVQTILSNLKQLEATSYDSKIGAYLKMSYPIDIIRGVLSIRNIYQSKFNSEVVAEKDMIVDYRNQNFRFVRDIKCKPYEFYKGDLFSSKVALQLPIWHPDMGIPYVAFFSRLSLSTFAEYTYLPQTEQMLNDKLVKSVMCYGASLHSTLFVFSISPADIGSSEMNYSLVLGIGTTYTPTSYDPTSIYQDETGKDKFTDERLKFGFYLTFATVDPVYKSWPADINSVDIKERGRRIKCTPGYQSRKR